MATINPTVAFIDDNTVRFTYLALLQTDLGAPIGPNHIEFADRNVSVSGTAGGGSVVIQGSDDDGVTYDTLHDQSDNDLSMSTGNEQILQVTQFMRPFINGGSGTTSFKVVILARRMRKH